MESDAVVLDALGMVVPFSRAGGAHIACAGDWLGYVSAIVVRPAAHRSDRVSAFIAGSPLHHRRLVRLAGDLVGAPAACAVLRVLGDGVTVDVEDVDGA